MSTSRRRSRLVSVVTALFLAAPVLALAPPAARGGVDPVDGDWTVTGFEEYWDTVFEVDGNLTVASPNGKLVIHNGGIRIVQDGAHVHWLTVNGVLELEDSVLTTHTNQVDPYLNLTVTVTRTTGEAYLNATRSTLKFPGSFAVGTNGHVRLTDSTVTGFERAEIDPLFPSCVDDDSSDNAPEIILTGDAEFDLVGSEILNLWESDPSGGCGGIGADAIRLSGTSTFTVLDSFVAVDYEPSAYTHNEFLLEDSSRLFAYNLSLEDAPPRMLPAINVVETNARAAILRFLDAQVLDANGVPVNNADLNVVWSRNSTAVTYPEAGGTSPTAKIAGFLGETLIPPTWDKTGIDGRARIPLWTDTCTLATMPNCLAMGDFEVTATASGGTPDVQPVQFPVYPDMAAANNTVSATFRIDGLFLPQPDLVVDSIDFDPNPPRELDNVTVTITIRNQGTGGASGVIVRTFENLALIDERPLPPGGFLAGLGTQNFTLGLPNVTAGQHTLQVVVDPDDNVTEGPGTAPENNNTRTAGFSATPLGPDLAVTLSAGPAFTGSPVDLNAQVVNVGHRATTVNVRVDFYVGSVGNLVGFGTIPPLAAGNASSVTISWLPSTPGQQTVIAKVDPSDVVKEPAPYSEANNVHSIVVIPQDAPNLVVTAEDITLDDPFPVAGTDVQMHVWVSNNGPVATNTSFGIEFQQNGALHETTSLSTLGSGERTELLTTTPLNFATCGLQSIGAIADTGNVIQEGSAREGDNTATKDVLVYPGGPDNVTTYGAGPYPAVTADLVTTKSWIIEAPVTIRDATVTFLQGEGFCDKHFVKVLDGGSLTLDNATIASNGKLVVYVSGSTGTGGRLIAKDSRLLLDGADGSGQLYLGGTGSLTLEDTDVDADVVASSAATASLTARRTTFSGTTVHIDTRRTTTLWDVNFTASVATLRLLSDDFDTATVDFDVRNVTFSSALTSQLRFRRTQAVELTSVSLAKTGNWWEGLLEGSAVASRYWWLAVRAVDGTGTLVNNSQLTLSQWSEPDLDWKTLGAPVPGWSIFRTTSTSWPVTAADGWVLYRALSEVRFAGAPHWANATYLADGLVVRDIQYEPDEPVPVLVTADTSVDVVFSSLTPDFEVLDITVTGPNGASMSQPVQTVVTFEVDVRNNGNVQWSNVSVAVFAGTTEIYRTTLDFDRLGTPSFTFDYVFPTVQAPGVSAVVDPDGLVAETDEGNNVRSECCLDIFPWPDLAVTSLVAFLPIHDNPGFVEVTVSNALGTESLVSGRLELRESPTGASVASANLGRLTPGETTTVNLTWTPSGNGTVDLTARALCLSPARCDFNPANDALTVPTAVLARPDLYMIDVDYAGQNFTLFNDAPGKITVELHNLAAGPAYNVMVSAYLDGGPDPIANASVAYVPAATGGVMSTVEVDVEGILIPAVGGHTLKFVADPDDAIVEGDSPTSPEEANNFAIIFVTVTLPQLELRVTSPTADPRPVVPIGDTMVVKARVFFAGTNNPVPNVEVTAKLVDADGATRLERAETSGNDGRVTILLPLDATSMAAGEYTLVLSVQSGTTTVESDIGVTLVRATVSEFPWLIVILIIVIAAVVIGVVAYTKFYGLGKMVECGNCGQFIPEDAMKCPNCNVEFEKDMAKCSNCQSWIPIDVKTCPECGVEFTTGEVEVKAYEEKMRAQYDEFVARMRAAADATAGRKVSDAEFDTWWKAQPTYMTFQDWLREEEEMRKMGSRPCPNCQTPNSFTAKVCHKCGTMMEEGGKGAPPKRPPAAPSPPPPAPVPAKGPGQPPAGAPPTPAPPPPGAPAGPEVPPGAPVPRKVIRRPAAPPPPDQPVPRKVIRPGEPQEGEQQGQQ